MTDKMIEEMASCDNCIHKEVCHIHECYNDCAKEVKETGCVDYQPKISENSVVLTNDEWARLRNLEINYNDAYEAYCEYAIQNKGLREENTQLRLENNDLEAQVEQAHKEAVKEFLTELFKQYSVFNDNDVIIAWQVKEALKNTLKQFGVEVEE